MSGYGMQDLISRQAAIKAVGWYSCHSGDKLLFADNVLKQLPSAEPERHGRWIHIRTEPDGNALYECSECHKGEVHVPIVEVHYCWNCGARMDGENK